MPLHDHFRPPVSLRKSWESIHNGWAFVIAQRLNGTILPARFEATPKIHLSSHIEEEGSPPLIVEDENTIPIQTYAPPAPPLAAEVVMADADTFEINVYKQDGGWKLIAAIELVSPANKDRSSHRRAFATKVASYLQQGVSVVTVDVVTERTANLHEDVSAALRLPDALDWHSPTGLSAVCYRLLRVEGKERLEVWPHQLAVGSALPTVPLWLEPVLAVPLELELTYTNTCESLRIA